MSTRFGFIKNWQIGLALIGVGMIVGCAGFQKQSPDPVPEIMPGILVGYLDPATLPDSLTLLPPPPADGSAAFALDEEVSRKGLALRGTPRWDLAARDAELMFPEAAGTFSCALGIPITEQNTPHLYILLRRTLADAGLSTYTAKNNYQRKRAFMVNEETHLYTGRGREVEKGRLLSFRAYGHRLGLGVDPHRDCAGTGGRHPRSWPGLR
jgi:acid phosphatase (class A)